MNDDQDDEKFRLMPIGDMMTLAVALVFLAGFLWLIFGPSPFAGLYDSAKTAPAQPQEVIVTVPAKGK
jgi:multidrug efflux pump subunit AcrA (membrane-fusion protein)